MAKNDVIIDMNGIVKKYYIGQPNELEILHGIDLKVYDGEFVAIVGESGSGKSTLMNIIGALDRPTSGEYYFNGNDISKLPAKKLSKIRNSTIGFVFQNFQLLGGQTALENVELPLTYANIPRKERRKRAEEALARVGLHDRMDFFPNQLSGGQKQRVAIARALVNNPSIVLADEPTGALDSRTGEQVMDLFEELNREGVTVLVITHDRGIASRAGKKVEIRDGELGDPEDNGK